MKKLIAPYCLFALIAIHGVAQTPFVASSDLTDLPRLKTYSAHRSSSNNRLIRSNDDSKRIMPGETYVMADLQGPGTVNHIWLTIADNEFAWPRLVRLRVYYDGKKTPSVDVPLGDFFGVGHGYERDLDSAPIRNSSFGRARNSYWTMPFRKSCRITVTDEGNRPVTSFYYHVDWQKHVSLPNDIGYFHAYYRQERPAISGKNYEFLNVRGSGHYVGTVMNVIQAGVGWFGEGDDLFYIDGAKHPQIMGTGSEDYVNEAWGLRVAYGPWAGTPVAEGERVGARLTGYRWHVPDPIPFTKSLWAGIEHAGWTYNADGSLRSGFEERPDFFSSAAFWYQKEVNENLPEPPFGEARLPLGNAQQIAVEDSLSEITTSKGKASVQREVDWGKDLLTFEAEGIGSQINVPLDIPEKGRYEILGRIGQAPDYGNYYVLLDGKPMNLDNRQAATSEIPTTGPEIFQNYLPEIYIAVDRPFGWLELTKGRHILSFVCTGHDGRSSGYNLGINDVVLERVQEIKATAAREPTLGGDATGGTPSGIVYRGLTLSAYRTKLKAASGEQRAQIVRSIGGFRQDALSAIADLSQALGDPDVQVRAAAAWALSQVGSAGGSATPALVHALSDSSPRVRSLAAVALREIGPHAVAAVPDLAKALKDPEPFVRAPAAEALGRMGSAAKAGVQPLVDVLSVSNEQTFVLRSAVTSLGHMGPSAVSALPALREMLKKHRITYVADAAIREIQGQPVEEW